MSVIAPSIELKVEAWYDCWAFFDLIEYQGGTKNFDVCHFDYILVLQAYQLWQSGRFTPELAKRLARILEQPEDTYIDENGKVLKPPTNRLLQMPRGHLKSTLTVGYIMWRIYRNPNIRMLHASNIRELSEAFIRELRNYFEDEGLQQKVWNSRPHIRGNLIPPLDKSNRRYYGDDNEADDRKVVWSNQQLQMQRSIKAKEPTILSTSVKAKATGQHYDIIIMDDIVDFDNCSTPAKIKQVKRWAGDVASIRTKITYYQACGVMPKGDKVGETLGDEYVVTGTHYDPGDYYAFLKEKRETLDIAVLNRNIYFNGTDPSDGYLWNKFTEKMERQLREELSDLPGVFEAQYLNLVNNPALQVLTTDFVVYASNEELLRGRGLDGVSFRCEDGSLDSLEPVMGVDFAISLSSRADYTAIAVGGKTFQRKLCALDFSVGHYSVEHTLDEIARLVVLWNVKRMYVETIAFQSLYRDRIIKHLAEKKVQCAVLDYKPVGNKHKRIESHLSAYFNQGNVVFNSRLKNQAIVMNTFNFFGRASAKDDPPDALAVVAEHSHPPDKRNPHNGRFRHTPRNTGEFNLKYGGVY
ncbi:terminase large subunit [Leptolyngbya phage Lbo240-yong1]|uniref:Terminase large subunit n=1 Tax=Leptolyngbya phage Lbo240-yong1 TaxID=2928836 RepID=A0A9X9E5E3_9CAUD|nr:terminase large subunit [Leptolyngbya phage Lbo240-yong1]